jgi:antitoxin YefM
MIQSMESSYTNLRRNLALMLDRVADDREMITVRLPDGRKVAIIPADELARLFETAHLLRSPKNARRLLNAVRRTHEKRS